MAKPWDADAASPGSPTSMDVLVRWLRTPGNYKRWLTQPKKPLLEEIVAALKKEKTLPRSPSSVRHKIVKLQHQFETATIWLKSGGHLTQFYSGGAGDGVKYVVKEKCPLYLELMPVFQSDDAKPSNSDAAIASSSDGVGAAGAEEDAKPAKLTAKGKRKVAPSVEAQQSNATKRKAKGSQTQPVMEEQAVVDTVETNSAEPQQQQQTIFPAERSLALTEFQRRSESRWIEYCGADHAPRFDEIRSQRLLDRDIERVDALAKLQLEAEAQRQELHTRCTKALERQRLRNAGLSEVEVDAIAPK